MRRAESTESTERLSIDATKGDKQWATVTGKKGNRKSQSNRRNLLRQFILATPDRNSKKCDIEQRRGFASRRPGTAARSEYSGDVRRLRSFPFAPFALPVPPIVLGMREEFAAGTTVIARYTPRYFTLTPAARAALRC